MAAAYLRPFEQRAADVMGALGRMVEGFVFEAFGSRDLQRAADMTVYCRGSNN